VLARQIDRVVLEPERDALGGEVGEGDRFLENRLAVAETGVASGQRLLRNRKSNEIDPLSWGNFVCLFGWKPLDAREGGALPCPFSRKKMQSSTRRTSGAATTAFRLSHRVGSRVAMATVDQSSMRGLVTA
jgi:hypothetical protein